MENLIGRGWLQEWQQQNKYQKDFETKIHNISKCVFLLKTFSCCFQVHYIALSGSRKHNTLLLVKYQNALG